MGVKMEEKVAKLRYISKKRNSKKRYSCIGFTIPWAVIDAYNLEKKLGKLYLVEVEEGDIIFKPIKGDDKN